MAPNEQTSAAPADGLDDLYDYGVDGDDVFRPFDANIDVPIPSKPQEDAPKADLGIDEEIKQTKKRKPVPKLDEERLLSQKGIPKLRKINKQRLKFKGKGHEFSDVARMLALYQLWLDDLYPRAKFADGLAMVEKLGHSKRMHTMRREWINESKVRALGIGEGNAESDPRVVANPNTDPADVREPERPSGDAQNSSMGKQGQDGVAEELALFVSDDEPEPDGLEPSGDELDALMAEDQGVAVGESNMSTAKAGRQAAAPDARDEDFAAEMDVMAELGW